MLLGLTLLETEGVIPGYVYGIIAFGLLICLMLSTLAIGKGRKHS